MKDLLKLEHVAEALVSKFFEVFKDKGEIDSYNAKTGKEQKIKFSDIIRYMKTNPRIEPQFQVNKFFEVSDSWKKRLGCEDDLVIDDITCFDCAIVDSDNKVLPIEVKSGNSKRYKHVNAILSHSYKNRKIGVSKSNNHRYLKGDMIALLSASIFSKSVDKEPRFEKDKVFKPLHKGTHHLHDDWILVVRTNDHIKNYKVNLDNKISYILSLDDIIDFLQKETSLLKEREGSFKDELWESFLNCIKFK